MSGHNKWSTIKHKKAKTDAARSQSWTKVVRELIVAAQAGTDPEFNAALRLAIQKAKACNMPKDNIERAIKRGSGEGEQVHYDQIVYEGRGAGGVAILIETLTDNKNRTVANVRSMLSKNGGQMGEAGSCAWQFKTVGQITLEGDNDADEVMMAALDAGAEDVNEDGTIVTAPSEVAAVSKKLEEAGYKIDTMEITRVATNLVAVDEKAAASLLKLCGILEDDDDVQNVYTNADISDEIMEKLDA
jgi:YebC/PmpR family DNA-binding regulatory protein